MQSPSSKPRVVCWCGCVCFFWLYLPWVCWSSQRFDSPNVNWWNIYFPFFSMHVNMSIWIRALWSRLVKIIITCVSLTVEMFLCPLLAQISAIELDVVFFNLILMLTLILRIFNGNHFSPSSIGWFPPSMPLHQDFGLFLQHLKYRWDKRGKKANVEHSILWQYPKKKEKRSRYEIKFRKKSWITFDVCVCDEEVDICLWFKASIWRLT